MAKGSVRAGFMAGATFYSDNPEYAPYLKKGTSGQRFPLNRDTVANIEVANERGRREEMSAVMRSTSGSIEGLMSDKGVIMVFIKLQNGASFMAEIDKDTFQALLRHAIDWETDRIKEYENFIETYAKETKKKIEKRSRVEKESKIETKGLIPEARAKYGPGYDKIMRVVKVAILCALSGGILLSTTERLVSLGAILLLLGFFLLIYSLVRLCWARYKTSKG